MSFIAILVHYGYFKTVEYNFNVVGHTHTKIDGLHGSQKGRLFGKKRKNDHLGCFEEIVQCLWFFHFFHLLWENCLKKSKKQVLRTKNSQLSQEDQQSCAKNWMNLTIGSCCCPSIFQKSKELPNSNVLRSKMMTCSHEKASKESMKEFTLTISPNSPRLLKNSQKNWPLAALTCFQTLLSRAFPNLNFRLVVAHHVAAFGTRLPRNTKIWIISWKKMEVASLIKIWRKQWSIIFLMKISTTVKCKVSNFGFFCFFSAFLTLDLKKSKKKEPDYNTDEEFEPPKKKRKVPKKVSKNISKKVPKNSQQNLTTAGLPSVFFLCFL